MNNREAYNFVGKCLSIGQKPQHVAEIRHAIRTGLVEWEKIVWVSTAHLVFPALYLQLKRSELIQELPADLVDYMEEFTNANRERNRLIVDQAIEIIALLNKEGISPVFLKGTAHLLEGLYLDPAERMVGDIDLLVDENELEKSADILIHNKYLPLARYNAEHTVINRHYPRLVNQNKTAAVEIHHQVLPFPYHKLFSSNLIMQGKRVLDIPGSAYAASTEHQILHTMYSIQINDAGYFKAKFQFSQIYNLLNLSLKHNPLDVITAFGKSFQLLNANLALASNLLGDPDSLQYKKSGLATLFLFRIRCKINSPKWARISEAILYLPYLFLNYAWQMIHSLYDRRIRNSVYRRMINREWYGEHLRRYYGKKKEKQE